MASAIKKWAAKKLPNPGNVNPKRTAFEVKQTAQREALAPARDRFQKAWDHAMSLVNAKKLSEAADALEVAADAANEANLPDAADNARMSAKRVREGLPVPAWMALLLSSER